MSQPNKNPSTAKEYYQNQGSDYVRVSDVSNRDGEQGAFCNMEPDEKIRVAKLLDKARVDIQEVGTSADTIEIDTISRASEETSWSTMAAFARNANLALSEDKAFRDIEGAIKSVEPLIGTGRARIHLLSRTSEGLRAPKGISEKQAYDNTIAGVRFAAQEMIDAGHDPDLQVYYEGGAETEPEFLHGLIFDSTKAYEEILEKNGKKGEYTHNIPSTRGRRHHRDYFECIRGAIDATERSYQDYYNRALGKHIIFAAHTHNDRGLAVAAALEGIDAGARQVDGSIMGIGERLGNADIIQVVLNLYYEEREEFKKTFGFLIQYSYPLALEIATILGIEIPIRLPFLGEVACATEAGIHAEIYQAYLWVNQEELGCPDYDKIIVGKRMGKHGIAQKLLQAGLMYAGPEVTGIFAQDLRANITRKMGADQIIKDFIMPSREVAETLVESYPERAIQLASYEGVEKLPEGGGDPITHYSFDLKMGDEKASIKNETHDTLIGTLAHAIKDLTGLELEVVDYSAKNVEGESSGNATVVSMMRLKCNGEERIAIGVAPNQNLANIYAFRNAACLFLEENTHAN